MTSRTSWWWTVVLLLLLLPAPPSAAEPVWRILPSAADDPSLGPTERIFAGRSCAEYRLLPLVDPALECGARVVASAAPGTSPAGPTLNQLTKGGPTLDQLTGGDASTHERPRELFYRFDRPQKLLAAGVVAADVGVTALNSLGGYQKRSFHVNHEGFFGEDTSDGGADKASHFVDYYIVSRELSYVYEILGFREIHAHWMGFGTAVLGGVVNEVSDGFTRHGFSYEDLLMDTLGAGMAATLATTRLDDLVGFRTSHLPGPTYVHDVYSMDLKLEGVARRLGLQVGPLRWLLLSVTYGVKGYRDNASSDEKQRQVGFEIGLNLQQILNDLNVRRNTWWGYGLHVVADNVRFPYTAVGFRYDLNHGKWYGPNTGNY